MAFQIKSFTKYVALLTSGILLLAFCFYLYRSYKRPDYPPPIPVYTKGQPSEGNPHAKVHIVAVEDPTCSTCFSYHKNVYPSLKRDYIDKGIVKYTVILVAFLPNSRPVATALMCAMAQSPKEFFALLNAVYLKPIPQNIPNQVISEHIVELAKDRNIHLDINLLQNCITRKEFSSRVSDNTTYAKNLMGGYIQTPTLYVNGMKVINPTLDELKAFILHASKTKKLKKKDM